MSTDDRMDALLHQAGTAWREQHHTPAEVRFDELADVRTDVRTDVGTDAQPIVATQASRRTHRRVTVWASAAAIAAAVVVGAFVVGRGTGHNAPAPAAQAALAGTDWQLTALRSADGAALDVVSPAALTVGKDRIGGTDACNTIDGPATFDPSEIHVGDLATTDMGCIDRPSGFDAEVALIHAVLAGSVGWSVNGDALTLSKPGAGTLVYRAVHHTSTTDPAALTGSWVLTTIEQHGAASTPTFGSTLTVDPPGYTVTHRCSTTQGTVVVGTGTAAFTAPHILPHSCPPPAGTADPVDTATVDSVLTGTVQWQIKDGQLTITKAGVGSLVYRSPLATGPFASPTGTSGSR